MKRYIAMLLAVILVLPVFTSCKKKRHQPDNVNVTGEWQLVTFAGVDAHSPEVNLEVYVSFSADRSFEIFQKLGAGHFSKFTGTYTVSGSVLSGQYSKGVAWGSSYDVTVDKKQLVLRSKGDSVEESVYVSSVIPASVREDAAIYSDTRAGQEETVIPLL